MHRFACHGALRSGFNRFVFCFLCSAGGSILAESRYVLFHFSLPFHVESLGAEEEKKKKHLQTQKQAGVKDGRSIINQIRQRKTKSRQEIDV